MRFGYARASTPEQSLGLQLDALDKAGCKRIYTDQCGGAGLRPQREALLDRLRERDVIVVWKLDRFGRSVVDLVTTLELLRERQVDFVSLTEGFDTTQAPGRLLFDVIAAVVQFERGLIRERTLAGLQSVRARGKVGGRKRALSESKTRQVRMMLEDPEMTIANVCETFGISRSALYRALKHYPAPKPKDPRQVNMFDEKTRPTTAVASKKRTKKVMPTDELPPNVPENLKELELAVMLLGNFAKSGRMTDPVRARLEELLGASPTVKQAPIWKSALKGLSVEMRQLDSPTNA